MTHHARSSSTLESPKFTELAPLEVPSWHLELPLRWPQLIFGKPATVRLYQSDHPTAIPTKQRTPTLPTKAKRKRRMQRRRKGGSFHTSLKRPPAKPASGGKS